MSAVTGKAYKLRLSDCTRADGKLYLNFPRLCAARRRLAPWSEACLIECGTEEETMKLALGCVAGVVLIATTACGPRTPDYEKTADNALSSAALEKVNADYDKDARTIHLKGTVDTENERQRAADVVQKA